MITALFTLISGIIFPTAVTPVSAIAAFGLLFPLVLAMLAFIRRLARGSGD